MKRITSTKRVMLAAIFTAALAGCGDKVPESQAAKDLGNAPKQTVDKAAADTAKALEQGVQRDQKADQAAQGDAAKAN